MFSVAFDVLIKILNVYQHQNPTCVWSVTRLKDFREACLSKGEQGVAFEAVGVCTWETR